MSRYVLLYKDSEPHPDDLEQIERAPGVTLLDQTVKRAMLIEASDDAISDLREKLKNWIVAEEVEYRRPRPAKKILRHRDEG